MLTVQVLAGLLIFTHCLGIIAAFLLLGNYFAWRAFLSARQTNKHFCLMIGISALVWEITILLLLLEELWDCTVVRVFRYIYDRAYDHRMESCPGHFQKNDDNSKDDIFKITCKDCGLSLDVGYCGGQYSQYSADELNREFHHQRETEQWKKFKRSIWYKHLR